MFMVRNYFPLYFEDQFYWWRRPDFPEKPTELPQVADNLFHIVQNKTVQSIMAVVVQT
jgi:hypothetical protein